MPKSKQSTAATGPAAVTPSAADSADRIRECADALYRSAAECCRQHERLARVMERSQDEAETRMAEKLASLCDEGLAEMVASYEKSASSVQLNGGRDEAWWHKANALWHSSREFARRLSTCERAARQRGDHTSAMLGELAVDYELEASALLALQQATAAYRKERPDA